MPLAPREDFLVLLAGITALFGVVGQALGGQGGMLIAQLIAAAMNFIMPTVAIAPHAQPNAFATGRNPRHAVVCVTEGLARLVDQDELEGVLAHALGHVRNRDMFLQTLSATMAGAISHLARTANAVRRIPMDVSPTVAPLAQIGPLSACRRLSKLFSTHPSTEERVARLRAMATTNRFG